MFSQRNNPYCDLLHFSLTNVENKYGKTMFALIKKIPLKEIFKI